MRENHHPAQDAERTEQDADRATAGKFITYIPLSMRCVLTMLDASAV